MHRAQRHQPDRYPCADCSLISAGLSSASFLPAHEKSAIPEDGAFNSAFLNLNSTKQVLCAGLTNLNDDSAITAYHIQNDKALTFGRLFKFGGCSDPLLIKGNNQVIRTQAVHRGRTVLYH